jgi:hypothetical protein
MGADPDLDPIPLHTPTQCQTHPSEWSEYHRTVNLQHIHTVYVVGMICDEHNSRQTAWNHTLGGGMTNFEISQSVATNIHLRPRPLVQRIGPSSNTHLQESDPYIVR